MAYATTNPYTGEVVKTFPDATDAEVSQAIGAAHEAFLAWRERSFEERGAILQRAADLLRENAEAHAGLLTLEMGKITAEALAEVELSARIFEYYVKHAEALLAPEKLPVADPAEGDALLVHEPLGVILAIEPWNFPYYQIARILAPQLAAGNTLLLKHAANVPQSADAFEKLMLDAGLPQGAFKNLYATRQQIETIINDPRVHGVALTGSEGAGAVVAAQAGKALKKSTLELLTFKILLMFMIHQHLHQHLVTLHHLILEEVAKVEEVALILVVDNKLQVEALEDFLVVKVEAGVGPKVE